MQPEINQPRVSDEHGQSGLKKAGILNLIADDLPHDMSLELRQNIIRHANEIYHMGTQNNSEYATVLDSTTGELLDGNKDFWLLTNNDSCMVNIPENAFDGEIDSISIIHNHTNGSFHSDKDVQMLVKRSAVKDVYLVSDGRLLRIAKTAEISYNVGKDNINSRVEHLVRRNMNINYALATGNDLEFNVIVKLFAEYGILIERW